MQFGKSSKHRRRVQTQRRTVKIEEVVEGVLRKRGGADKIHERRVFDVWESVVGEANAAQSAPTSLYRGILRVDVSHPAYAHQMTLMKIKIIEKLKSKLENLNTRDRRVPTEKKVTDIRFNFNPRFSKDRSHRSKDKSESDVLSQKNSKPVSPEMKEQIESVVSVVTDQELREALKQLFTTQCADTKTDNN